MSKAKSKPKKSAKGKSGKTGLAPGMTKKTEMGMKSLQGQFLVAMPMIGDSRFADSVLYVVEHNGEGAMAIAINEPMPNIQFGDVLSDLELFPDNQAKGIQSQISVPMFKQPVLRGGPVQTSQGFVLHSKNYQYEGVDFAINDDVSLSANLEILRAMAFEKPPENAVFALGYCGWSPGQLEGELAQNAWLTVPHDLKLLFDVAFDKKYDRALGLLGITKASLSAFGGRA